MKKISKVSSVYVTPRELLLEFITRQEKKGETIYLLTCEPAGKDIKQ